jgi:hypothetical protein
MTEVLERSACFTALEGEAVEARSGTTGVDDFIS